MIKQSIYDEVLNLSGLSAQICETIWNNPELGGTEIESANYMRNVLREEGFTIVDEPKLPTAFYAEYGSGKPVIAIMGEYDALPGLSQVATTTKDAIVEGGAGHGCGHNTLGSAAAVGAIAVKRFLEKEGISGTVRFYGCPEEELLVGKVKMVEFGMFEGCDIAISWHPGSVNMVYDKGYLANTSIKFFFKGRTSHAAAAPELGRSALDAVELMSVGANYLREHVVDRTRIHYSTDGGGFAPNIVPDKASAWYFVRGPRMEDVKDTTERLKKVAMGAAMMTETEVEIVPGIGCCEMIENTAYADLTYANLIEADQPKYTEEEINFAKQLQNTVNPEIVAREQKNTSSPSAIMAQGVSPRNQWSKYELTGSSDSGDISYLMPMNLFTAACWPVGVTHHTWQVTSSCGTSIGQKGALYASKVIAGIAYDLLTRPDVFAEIVKEFKEQNTSSYKPMYVE